MTAPAREGPEDANAGPGRRAHPTRERRRAPVLLETPRLLLAQPRPEEAERVLAFYEEERAHLEPWEPRRPDGFYTPGFWRARLAESWRDTDEDRAVRLFLVARRLRGVEAGRVVGSCNLTNVTRGALQGCSLGYSLARDLEGRGLMREALEAVLPWAFAALGLHRVEASYQPHNVRSAGLLRRLGFVVEGYSRDFLLIDGRWADHVRTALVGPAQ